MTVSSRIHVTTALFPGMSLSYTADIRLCGPRSGYGRFEEAENSSTVPGIEPRTV